METYPIYAWADGTWCEAEDLEQYLSFKSDDYKELWIDASFIPDDYIAHLIATKQL